MPVSKITAADSANGSVVKKFRVCFLPSSKTEKSLDNKPLTRRPESSFTMTGTSTWLTLVTILYSSSLPGPRSAGAPPGGTVVTLNGGAGATPGHKPGLPWERNWWAALDSEAAVLEREAPGLGKLDPVAPDSAAAHWEKAARRTAHPECPASAVAGQLWFRKTGKGPPLPPQGPWTFYRSLKTREPLRLTAAR